MAKKKKANREGCIYFNEKRNNWIAEIHWNDKNGNLHRKRFSDIKKNVAKKKLEEFKRQLLISTGDISTKDITFKEYADYWLVNIMKNKLKPSSYLRKSVTLTRQVYPYLGNIPINKITHSDIQDMVNELNKQGLSYSTIKKAYEAVNGCFRNYRIKTACLFNPCECISLPTNKERDISNIIFFNDEQRQLIKQEATRKYKNGKPVYRLGHAIIILMYTGMRIGEFLALTWDDVDFENRTIIINKNAVVSKDPHELKAKYEIITQNSTKTRSGNRVIPISQIALDSFVELKKINGDKKYIVSSKNGKQIMPRNINRMFHSILIKSGIAKTYDDFCGVHTLRHTFASMLFQNGCDVKIVSEILGHSNTKITENIYIHILQQQKIKAIQDIDKYSN